jgi:uncharacterized membrane protein YphA (DoxX/SURF4 family)
MPPIFSSPEPSYAFVKMLIPAFMALLFLQSGFDKLLNYRDNLAYLTGHFKKSPLASLVGILMPTITFLEISAGILCAWGCFRLYWGNNEVAYWGLMLSAVSLLCLFGGQRIAKDYAGAGGLTGYFLLCVIGLLMLI